MITRILVAMFVGAIVMFGLGFLIYGLLLADFMKTNMTVEAAKLMIEPPNFILLFASNLAFAWVLALIFERWAGIKTFVTGAIAGAIIAASVALAIDLQFLATMKMLNGFVPVIIDVLAAAVLGGISGGVIGFVLGKMPETS